LSLSAFARESPPAIKAPINWELPSIVIVTLQVDMIGSKVRGLKSHAGGELRGYHTGRRAWGDG
jgi:hypothetical protein